MYTTTRWVLPLTALAMVILLLSACKLIAPGCLTPKQARVTRTVELTADFAVPVLMYHRICALTPREMRSPLMRDLTVAPDEFDRQMRYLADNGFTLISLESIETALRTHSPLPAKAVAITMDDGYRDNFTSAYPILRKYLAPATIFVVTGVVESADHLSWREMELMHGNLVGFQSHTVHHYDLTTLPKELLDEELLQSKLMLENRLESSVTQLAFPSGAYNTQVLSAMQDTGYAIGWKKGGGPVTPNNDPYLLPRIRVRGCTTMQDFARKVWSGVYLVKMRNGSAV